MDFQTTSFNRELRQQMSQSFNKAELRLLAADLMIDWEALPGEEKQVKIHEFIGFLDRRKRIGELIKLVHHERPKVDWPGFPPDTIIEMNYDYEVSCQPENGESFFTNGKAGTSFSTDIDNCYFDEGMAYAEALSSTMFHIWTFEFEKKGYFSASEISIKIKNMTWSWDLPEFTEDSDSPP